MQKPTDITTPELWQFPMDYPLAIIGIEGARDDLMAEVIKILQTHFDDFDSNSIAMRESKTGRFVALKTRVRFLNANTVNALYADLANAKTVRTVL